MNPHGEKTTSFGVEVNGEALRGEAAPRVSLAEYLREDLGLTGTHVGCDQGWCGACTVMVDDGTARACLTLAVQTDGCRVTTVEGLADHDPAGAALRDAFVRHHASQCGFCTPGMLAVACEIVADARAGQTFTREALRQRLSACTCRCTGYLPIIAAVEEVIDAIGR